MRNLTDIHITFIPANKTKDDPKGLRAYLAAKWHVEDEDRTRQYGYAQLLDGRPMVVTDEMLTIFMLAISDKVIETLMMSPDEVTESEPAP
jgi:hypothetical protein